MDFDAFVCGFWWIANGVDKEWPSGGRGVAEGWLRCGFGLGLAWGRLKIQNKAPSKDVFRGFWRILVIICGF
jgi:hypothetical protein